jgi:hypothetical protein
MSDDLDAIRTWMCNGTVPDRSGEVASLQAEVEMLRHEVMCAKFEVTGLYAKLRDANEEIEALRRLIVASPTTGCSGE